MVTVLKNPVDTSIRIAISVNDADWHTYVVRPYEQISIETDISHIKNSMKIALKGDRRIILLKTLLKSLRM